MITHPALPEWRCPTPDELREQAETDDLTLIHPPDEQSEETP